jgi:hypothetical protein
MLLDEAADSAGTFEDAAGAAANTADIRAPSGSSPLHCCSAEQRRARPANPAGRADAALAGASPDSIHGQHDAGGRGKSSKTLSEAICALSTVATDLGDLRVGRLKGLAWPA